VRLLESVSQFWLVRGHLREGWSRFEHAVEATADGDPALHARALVQGAVFPFKLRELDAAERWWEEALALYRQLDDDGGITRCTAELGAIAVFRGDLDRARALCEEAAAGFERVGNRVRQGIVKANLAAIASMQGDLRGSLAHGVDTIALQEEIGDTDGLAITLHNVGRTSTAAGELDDARRYLGRGLRIARSIGYREVIAFGLESSAELVATTGDEPLALRLLAASEAAFAALGTNIDGEEAEGAARLLEQLTASLGADAVAQARAAAAEDLDGALEAALAYLAVPASEAAEQPRPRA
jgi:tetratricopeptide (TPR) repeat protein